MKNWLFLFVLIAQLAATVQLVRLEGWLSGIVFFLVTTIFIGVMANIAALINKLWLRIFNKP